MDPCCVCESHADWLKFDELSNRDQLVRRTCYRKIGEPAKRKPKHPLKVHVLREKLPEHRFMQDNDSKHTSRVAKAFFEENSINWWRTPPESPDLNPIEDLWHKLKFYLESRVKPRTKQELIDGIKKFWSKKITVQKCNKYKAIPDVIAEGGRATKH